MFDLQDRWTQHPRLQEACNIEGRDTPFLLQDGANCGKPDPSQGGEELGSWGLWGRGWVTLLGDAAHATVPIGK